MSTVNISLPKAQLNLVNSLVKTYGFANRSEFIRALLRLINYKPDLIAVASTFPFVTPVERSVKKIMADFKKSKKYSTSFLKDLEEGLKSTDYFNK